jgi:hypothetical protein
VEALLNRRFDGLKLLVTPRVPLTPTWSSSPPEKSGSRAIPKALPIPSRLAPGAQLRAGGPH